MIWEPVEDFWVVDLGEVGVRCSAEAAKEVIGCINQRALTCRIRDIYGAEVVVICSKVIAVYDTSKVYRLRGHQQTKLFKEEEIETGDRKPWED